MTRIALLTPYADPVPGGISTVIDGLRTLLSERGHEVYLLAGQGNGDRPAHSNLGVGLSYVWRAAALLRHQAIDVAHCHAHWYTLTAALRYRRAHPSTRLVFSFHTSRASPWESPFSWLLRKADVLTFVSGAQLAQYRSDLRLGGDLRILYPGVRPRAVEERAKSEWVGRHHLSGAFPVLAFVGPLDYEQKVRGVADLVGVLRKIRVTYPTAKLVVVGDGKLKRLVTEASRGMEDAVVVTGFVRDPSPAFATCDIYCHLSYRESFGIAVLEAMSMGCCVVALRSSGVSEVVDDRAALILDPILSEVTKAIQTLASDPVTRDYMKTNAQRTVLRFHTWNARWPQLASIYGLD